MKKITIFACFLFLQYISVAKTKSFGTWLEFDVSKNITRKLEFSLTPEVRFQDDFNVDEYMAEAKLSYKLTKFLDLAGAYRYEANVKKKSTSYASRFAFDACANHGFGRIDSDFRLRFTNYSESGDESGQKTQFFRYRAKLGYDLKNCRLKPFVCWELFHNLTEKEFDKQRCDIGLQYKISKRSKASAYYRLQDYFSEKSSIHILGLNYKLSL